MGDPLHELGFTDEDEDDVITDDVLVRRPDAFRMPRFSRETALPEIAIEGEVPAPEPRPSTRRLPEWSSALTGVAGLGASFLPSGEIPAEDADLTALAYGGPLGYAVRRLVSEDPTGNVRVDPQAAVAGYNDQALFGWADEANAAAEATTGPQTYDRAIGAERARREQLATEAPESTLFGQVAAIVPQIAAPGAGQFAAARGAGPLMRTLAAAGEGFGASGVYGAGASEADSPVGVIDDALGSAYTGGAFAGGSAGLGEAVRTLAAPARRGAERLRDLSNRLRISQAGPRGAGEVREIAAYPGTERFAGVLREEGATGRLGLGSVETAAERMGEVGQDAGGQIRGLIQRMDAEGVTVDTRPIVAELEAIATQHARIPGSSVGETARALADEYRALGESIPFSDAQRIKAFIDANRNFRAEAGGRLSPLAEQRGDLRRAVQRQMDEAVGGVEPGLAANYQRQRLRSGVARRVEDAAEERAQQAARNQQFGLTDVIAGAVFGGGAYAASQDPVDAATSALGGALINRVRRGREHAVAATGTELVERLLRGSPNALGRFRPLLENAAARGGPSLAAQHYVLSRQSAEYQATIRRAQEAGDDAEEEEADPLRDLGFLDEETQP